jgi:hypothetical protein
MAVIEASCGLPQMKARLPLLELKSAADSDSQMTLPLIVDRCAAVRR